MGEKITVSYTSLIVYIIFVVVASLLVGLLPVYVNRPTCDNSAVKSVVETLKQEPIKLPEVKQRARRSLPLKKSVIQNLPEHLKTIKSMSPRFNSLREQNLTYCSGLQDPQPVYYPWYDYRLPTNVYPINYDLYLFLPLWGDKSIYDGIVDVTVNITEPTNTFIMHLATDEAVFFENFTDKYGREVDMDCMGQFTAFEYLILQTKKNLTVENGPYKISLFFIASLNEYENGLFEFNFANNADPSSKNSTMLASKFEPLDARRAFPCFDEPQFKTNFSITIDHPPGSMALTNTPDISITSVPGVNNSIVTTKFAQTPKMPTSLIGIVVFYEKDFKKLSSKTNSGIPVNVWARNHFIDENQADLALEMTVNIFNQLEEIFKDVPNSLPPKIDLFAIPDYPTDAVPHFGLPIFAETKILMKNTSASERNKQEAALLIAKILAEFWFGNFVTFKWWNEIWLQEALGDYVKYFAVDRAYPEYSIKQQFITEEMVPVLIDDGYPSSHPINKSLDDAFEIEQYFDNIETSKAASLMRMVEIEVGEAAFFTALNAYLNFHPWGTGDFDKFLEKIGKIGPWSAKDFFARWINQPNYPVLFINLIKNGNKNYSINVKQDRHLNSEYSIFSGDLLYPSPWGFEWYVPLYCMFGFTDQGYNQVHYETFYISSKNSSQMISFPREFNWVHCDEEFSGYYVTSYSKENWEALAKELVTNQQNFVPEDRASIIHHMFTDSYTERNIYTTTVKVLNYLSEEKDYLPWRTVYLHVNYLLKVLDYDKAFFQLSNFFIAEFAKLETDALWQPSENHVTELLSETILELSCRLQDSYCINKTAELWPYALSSLQSGENNNSIPAYVRSIVYNYHFQNTYNVRDWILLFNLYDSQNDLIEQERYLKALTFTRLPWLLSELVNSIDRINSLDVFDLFKYMSAQPIGREIAWDYLRNNYYDLIYEYGLEDPRLGDLLINIASSFENEFMFYELLEFVFYTDSGATTLDRFKAIEIASTNLIWLIDNEKELINSFGGGGFVTASKHVTELSEQAITVESMKIKLKETYEKLRVEHKNKNFLKKKI